MPKHPSRPSSAGTTYWPEARAHDGFDSLDGAAFDEAGLQTMKRALDDVCNEVAPRASPAEREFIAWLIVRLSCRGVKENGRLKNAAVAALRWRSVGACAL